jgi:hypothetical protein
MCLLITDTRQHKYALHAVGLRVIRSSTARLAPRVIMHSCQQYPVRLQTQDTESLDSNLLTSQRLYLSCEVPQKGFHPQLECVYCILRAVEVGVDRS